MASEVTPLLAEWRMENLDEGMGNGSSLEFHGTSRVVSMGGSGFAHPHFRMAAETGGAIAVAPGSKVIRDMDGLPGTGCLAVLHPRISDCTVSRPRSYRRVSTSKTSDQREPGP